MNDQLQCKEDIGAFAREEFRTLRLYDGATETLRALAATKQLALITNGRRSIIDQLLVRHDLHSYFELVVTRESVPELKPHPASIANALTYFNAQLGQSVMVGDSAKDLQAARNAGVDSILFYPPRHGALYDLNELMSYKPKHIVSSFQELSGLVR